MDTLAFDHTVLIIIVVIVSLTRLVRLVFASLRVCAKEYYDFRRAIRAMRAMPGERGDTGPDASKR